jgi:filamentous hemagglutinin family protein
MNTRIIVGGSCGFLGLLLGAMPGLGQSITLDGSLGLVRPLGNGPFYTIRQADGTTIGSNLFHSFGRFNLATGEIANFQSAAAIQNILARVTGGTASSIDGLIFTSSSAVNLFLINPSGIVFGPNAALDIGGTTRGDFTATTLDAIVWPDGSRFDAVNPGGRQPLLRIIGEPNGFLASQRVIPDITVNQSQLQVQNGRALRLLGGAVEVVGGPLGQLDAWGGRVEIGAIAGPGTVGLLGNGGFQFPDDLVRGDVRFTDQAFVDVMLGNGGDLTVLGRDIEVLAGSALLAGIFNNLGTATSQAGLLQLDATGTVTIAGTSSRVANDVRRGATGRGGNLEIRAQEVVVRDRAQLSTSTAGLGNAGAIRIAARDRVLFQDGSAAFSIVEAGATGQGGSVEISTGSLGVFDRAVLIANTRGVGDAGNVAIEARDSVLFQNGFAFSDVSTGARGRGGNVSISSGNLVVRDSSQLSAATFGVGDAGTVEINARDSVLFQDSAAFSNVTAGAKGQGGNVAISTESLVIRDQSGLLAGTFGLGDAGNVTISTGSLVVRDQSSLLASTYGVGDAGNVNIKARDSILFQDGYAASIVATGARGQGGNVEILTGSLEMHDRAVLAASTSGVGDAGNVAIVARDRVLFQGSSAAFSDVTSEARGQGGNVEISTGSLELHDGSGLLSSTGGIGDAGNVNIDARDSILFEDSFAFSIVAAGARGQGGNVEISTGSLVVRDGAALVSSTSGEGDAGTVDINARDRILLDGTAPITGVSSAIFTNNGSISNQGIAIGGTGKGGDVNVITPQLQVSNGAVIDSRTVNDQPGGTITLSLGNLTLLNGGQILSTSDGSGPAGTVRINATDGIRISGRDPTYADRLAQFRTAVAPISATSGIYVRSTATGAAGNVIIGDRGNTPRLILDSGEIIADSNAVNGGNISLNLSQVLAMRNGSLISATAGRAQSGGDGGNITIDAPFVLAIPQDNNDIIANAFSGTGGNITIDADAILNFTLNDNDKSFEQLRSQATNDISASSQFGSNGTLNLAGLNVDPSRGSVQLPIGLGDSADRLDSPCLANSKTSQGSFIITGRGGLASSPGTWRGTTPSGDWLSLDPGTIQTAQAAVPTSATQPSPVLASPVLEANEWQRTPQGQIQFLATTATQPRYNQLHCAATHAPLAETFSSQSWPDRP